MLRRYLAQQLSTPSGLIGRFVLGSLWNRRNAILNDTTLAQLQLVEGDRILDIGFGGGYLIGKMIPIVRSGLIAGVDVSPTMVENCRKRFKDVDYVDLRCARAEMLPYPEAHFTKVCSVNSIFYWEDFERGVAEIYRVLREMGRVVLTYTRKKDLDKKWFAQYGIKPFDDEEVQRALSRAGFHDITSSQTADRHREFVCMAGLKPSAYQESK